MVASNFLTSNAKNVFILLQTIFKISDVIKTSFQHMAISKNMSYY